MAAFNGSLYSVQLIAMIQKKYEARLLELERQNNEYVEQLAKRDSKIHSLNVRIRELELHLHHQQGARAALKQLYHSVDNKIMRTLTERGERKKKPITTHPGLTVSDDMEYGALLSAAREYDAKEFFALKKKVYTHNLKPAYRLVAKSYRVTRDGGMAGMKKIYKLRAH